MMPIDPAIFPRAILFDMDGTLTQPMLDFPRIKADMGIGNRPILEALAEMAPTRRAQAEAILLRHEDHAAAQSALNPGCLELLAYLADKKIPAALVTRNSRRSVDIVLVRHGLRFDATVAREDGPFKPDPRPLRIACAALGVDESTTWMVGDGQYDIEAAAAARIASVWISHGRNRPFDAKPCLELHDLSELLVRLRACEAASPPGSSNPPQGPTAV